MQYNTSWTNQLGVGVRKRRRMSTALIFFFFSLCLAIKWPNWVAPEAPYKEPKKPHQKTPNPSKQKTQAPSPPPKNQNIQNISQTGKKTSPRKHSGGGVDSERGLFTLFVGCSLAEKDHEEVGYKSSSLSNWRNLLKFLKFWKCPGNL